MKKRIVSLFALIAVFASLFSPAAAETTLGFARLAMSTNVRSGVIVRDRLDPGNTSYRLPEGAMVYVWDVRLGNDDQDWYHITCQYEEDGRLRGRQGWIAASCVETGPLFSDVVSVSGDENGFIALRRDGTVTGAARLFSDTSRFYRDLEEVSGAVSVSACAGGYLCVLADGTERVIGTVPSVGEITGDILLDTMQEERTVLTRDGLFSSRELGWVYPEEGADLGKVTAMEQKQGSVFMLTEDGTVACLAFDDDRFYIMPEEMPDFSGWTDVIGIDTVLWHPKDVYFYEVFAAVRKDGTARISPRVIERYTLDWTDLKQISLASDYLVGVTNSGTVYAAGRSEDIIAEASGWTGIEQVCACDGYCIGLRTDGTLVFAGKFTYGYEEK